MALVFHSGFEMGDFGEWSSTIGSPAVVGTQKKGGDYAMRSNTDATTAYVTAPGTAFPRVDFYIYIASLPTTDVAIFGDPSSGGSLWLTSLGELDYYSDGIKRKDGTTQLQTDIWYHIHFTVGIITMRVDINGNLEYTHASDIEVPEANYFGLVSSTTADVYFDDFLGNSTSGANQGDVRIVRASPNAAGEYAEFDTISGFGNCDEVPAVDEDFVDDSGVSVLHRECYNLQDSATIGVGGSDTVKAVNVWARLYDSGNSAQGIIVRDNSTDYLTLAIAGKAFTWKNKIYATNAPRGTAWTPAIFDAFQSGGYSEGSKDVWMSCVMVMVAFIPEEAPPAGIPKHMMYYKRMRGL